MPPKAKPINQPSKKTDQKKKEKVIEDKTFGLKNKKGSKMQKFVQQVEKQVKTGNTPIDKEFEKKKLEEKKKKEIKKKEEEELSKIFKPVQQKVGKGVDPKSVLCAYFKAGTCTKGDKCKFSHDLSIEKRAEKRSVYVDVRDDEEMGEVWDEERLKEFSEQKFGEADKQKPKTTNVCKHFLDAVESSKFGWFWECPNGNKCIYRHALPPGYMLKKDKKKDDKKEEISMEDLVERERALVAYNATKVTLETFLAWKKRKLREKKEATKQEEDKKKADFKAGRNTGLSGRDMFTLNPDLIIADNCEDGDEAFDTRNLQPDDEECEEEKLEYREINFDMIGNEANENDGTGTQAVEDRLKRINEETPNGDTENNSNEEMEGAVCGPIDENLFADDDDLDDLEDEVNSLELDSSEDS